MFAIPLQFNPASCTPKEKKSFVIPLASPYRLQDSRSRTELRAPPHTGVAAETPKLLFFSISRYIILFRYCVTVHRSFMVVCVWARKIVWWCAWSGVGAWSIMRLWGKLFRHHQLPNLEVLQIITHRYCAFWRILFLGVRMYLVGWIISTFIIFHLKSHVRLVRWHVLCMANVRSRPRPMHTISGGLKGPLFGGHYFQVCLVSEFGW
jgi:hypothetical protein